MGQDELGSASPGAGFEEFYRHWFPQLKRFLVWFESDRSITEDAAQETMISAERFWPTLQQRSQRAQRNWLFLVGGQRLSDERAKRRAENLQGEIADSPARGDGFQAMDDRLTVMAFVRKLPTHQIAPVVLHFYGFKDREIGKIVGIAPTSVRTYRSQGLKTLSAMLDAAGNDGGTS